MLFLVIIFVSLSDEFQFSINNDVRKDPPFVQPCSFVPSHVAVTLLTTLNCYYDVFKFPDEILMMTTQIIIIIIIIITKSLFK